MGVFDWIFKRKKEKLHLGWKDVYSVGIIEIDVQHKNLFKLYNDLVDAIYRGEGIKSLQKSLNSLVEYVFMHFNIEEGYMQKYSYPGYEAHKAEHKKLREKVYYIHKDFTEGKPVLTMDVIIFLRDWISDHILGVDMKYKTHMKERIPREYR